MAGNRGLYTAWRRERHPPHIIIPYKDKVGGRHRSQADDRLPSCQQCGAGGLIQYVAPVRAWQVYMCGNQRMRHRLDANLDRVMFLDRPSINYLGMPAQTRLIHRGCARLTAAHLWRSALVQVAVYNADNATHKTDTWYAQPAHLHNLITHVLLLYKRAKNRPVLARRSRASSKESSGSSSEVKWNLPWIIAIFGWWKPFDVRVLLAARPKWFASWNHIMAVVSLNKLHRPK